MEPHSLSNSSSINIGQKAEDMACGYLIKQGLKLIARNYRCKTGEIDLIMKDRECVVFVEVRYRKKQGFGSSAESVTWLKQKKLIRTANYYLVSCKIWSKVSCRFDVLAMDSSDLNAVQWIKDAFHTASF